jgi:hypothetical protein
MSAPVSSTCESPGNAAKGGWGKKKPETGQFDRIFKTLKSTYILYKGQASGQTGPELRLAGVSADNVMR